MLVMMKDIKPQDTYNNYNNYNNTIDKDEFSCNCCKKCNTLTLDICEEMFKEVRCKINEQYIKGTLPYVKEHHKSLHRKIWQAEKQIAAICKACTDEKYPSTVSELKQVLRLYYKHYIDAIMFYKGHLEDIG
jgi:hypothetical protein